MRDEKLRRERDKPDGREILQRIECELLVERAVRRKQRRCKKDRVAVRRCLCNELRADRARRPGAVLDDERLAKALVESLREEPRLDIGTPSGRGRNDDADGLDWVVLRQCATSS